MLIRPSTTLHLIITHLMDKTGRFNKTERDVLQSKSLTKTNRSSKKPKMKKKLKTSFNHPPNIVESTSEHHPGGARRQKRPTLWSYFFLNFPHSNLIRKVFLFHCLSQNNIFFFCSSRKTTKNNKSCKSLENGVVNKKK